MTSSAARLKSPELTVAIDYSRASTCPHIRADGAIGGLTPAGGVQMGLYSETQDPESALVVVREIQGEVSMTYEAAKVLHEWLGDLLG